MTSTHGFARVCGLVLLAAALAAPAPAQDFRGAITGRVTDTSNAVLPGATVTATNTATNQPTSSVTNSDGVYNLLFLTPGIYNVVTELPGFKKLERQRIEVRVGDRLTLDQRLELGGGRRNHLGHERGAAPRSELGLVRPGHRRAADRAAAALGRQPIHAGAAGARCGVHRRSEVLASVRQRRDHRRSTPTAPRAATSSRSTARPTWPTAGAWRLCRPPARCRNFGLDRQLRRRRRSYRRRARERHAQERHQRHQGPGLLLHARREAVGHRLLRQQERAAKSRR